MCNQVLDLASVTSLFILQALYRESSFVCVVFLHVPQILLIEGLRITGFSSLGTVHWHQTISLIDSISIFGAPSTPESVLGCLYIKPWFWALRIWCNSVEEADLWAKRVLHDKVTMKKYLEERDYFLSRVGGYREDAYGMFVGGRRSQRRHLRDVLEDEHWRSFHVPCLKLRTIKMKWATMSGKRTCGWDSLQTTKICLQNI